MKHKIACFIGLLILIWSACKKAEQPDDFFNTPVFEIFVEADPPISLSAGLNDYYLFTRADLGKDSVLVLSGAFAPTNCPSSECPGSLRFEFRNTGFGNTTEPDLLFENGQFWSYASPFDSIPSFHKVAIQWIDSSGTKLRSDYLLQPSFPDTAFFHIKSSEPWEINERGETTWKMNINFTCFLWDSTQTQMLKFHGGGVIGVGYR